MTDKPKTSEPKSKPAKPEPIIDRSILCHSTRYLPGHELRWDGPVGEVVAYDLEGKQLKAWTRDQNKDGKALGEAIKFCKERIRKAAQ